MWDLKIPQKSISQNSNRLANINKKLVATSGEREWGRGEIRVGD